jgi:pimeloyl-ACP methyl ester carboxylesterase
MKTFLNHIAINYNERGMPQGLPVVFIHGFPFSNEMWNPQINILPNNIYGITYDIRGHGQSDVGDGLFTIELFVDDLISLLDLLFIKKAVLCGLSMGGYIALRAFERHPDRVCGLILCDTKSEPDTDTVKIKRAVTIHEVKTAGVRAFAEDFVRAIFWEKTFERNPSAISFIKKIICENTTRGICGTLLALAARTDTTTALSSINIPTCIIVGENDKVTPPSNALSMHALISGSEMHILPHAAHMSNLENTQEFNEQLITFLKKL